MNTVIPEKKAKMLKALATLGFLAMIGFIAWASVQIVARAPKAFTSLASLAEGIRHYSDSLGKNDSALTLNNTSTTTEAGTPFILSWNKQEIAGTYAFTYTCTEGVAIDVVDTEGLRSIACDTRYTLGDTDTVTIIIDSEKQTQTEVPYTISYSEPNDFGPSHSIDNKVLVTNKKLAAVPDATVLGIKDKTGWKDTITTPDPKPSSTTTPITTPATKPQPMSTVLVSDPNGFTDLVLAFINTGTITNNTFTASTLKQNADGGFKFSVTNQGTKTSRDWSYTLTLPDGDIYTSPMQAPLLPSERATIALGFSLGDKSTYTIIAVVAENSDSNLKNNSFSQTVTVAK
jgi:hypothetical protein